MTANLASTAHFEIATSAPSYNADYSTAFWYYNDGSSVNKYIWSIANVGTNSEDKLRLSNTQALRLYSYDGGVTEINGSTTHSGLSTGWHLIVVRRSGLNLGVSLDGGSFVEFSNPAALSRLDSDRFWLGKDRSNNPGVGDYWNVVHWSRAISDTEAADFYTEDYASVSDTSLYDYWPMSADADAGANGNDFTPVNSPSFTTDPSGQTAWPGSVSTPTATGAATLPSLTAAGSATPISSSSGAASLPGITAAGSATLISSSSGSATLPALTASGSGSSVASSTGYALLPGISASGAGSGLASASAAASLPGITAAGSATPISSSTGVASLPGITAAGSATPISSSSGSATLPSLTAAGSATPISSSTGAASLPGITAAGSGSSTTSAIGSAVLPALTASGSGNSTSAAVGSASLPTLSAESIATLISAATIAAQLSGLTATASGVTSTPPELSSIDDFGGQEIDGVSDLTPDIHVATASGDYPLIAQVSAAASSAIGLDNPYDQAQYEWDFGDPVRPHTGSMIGINPAPITYHSEEWTFVDAMRMSKTWAAEGPNGIVLDSLGHILSIGVSTKAVTYIFQGISDYPDGTYTCYYDGVGTLEWSGDVTSVLSTSAGKQTISVTASSGIVLKISATDVSDPIRNIKLIMPGYEQRGMYRNQSFHRTYLDRYKHYSCLRFMDWSQVNNSSQVTWASRTTLDHATQDQTYGVCLELQIELANALRVQPWFCIPHQADNDYVTQMATLIRDTLHPELRARIEYSNEVWNFGFSQAGYARDQGALLSLGGTTTQNNRRYYAKRSVEIFNIFESVFGGLDRIERVIGDQRGGTTTLRYVLDFEDTYLKTDVTTIACYFGNNSGTPPTLGGVNEATIEATWDVDDMLDWCETSLATSLTAVATSYGVSDGEYSIPMIAYEGGQHLTGFTSSVVQGLMTDANRHPRMKAIYTTMLEGWAAATDGGSFCAFNSCMGFSSSGRWGVLESQTQARSAAPKFDALLSYAEVQAPCFPLAYHGKTGVVQWTDSTQRGPLAAHPYRYPGTYTATLTMSVKNTSQVSQSVSTTYMFTVTDTFTKMYFDSVNGNDANDGSLGNPKQSFTALKTWLEDGTENRRALLARGSSWTVSTGTTIETSHRRIGCYGPGERPLFTCTSSDSPFRVYNNSEVVEVSDFLLEGVDIDAADVATAAFSCSGGTPSSENNPRVGIHLLDSSFSNSDQSCVIFNSNGVEHVSIINCRVDHGDGDSQGISCRMHELALSAPREFLSIVNCTLLGGNGWAGEYNPDTGAPIDNGDTLDQAIYPSGWHQFGLFRWIHFEGPEASGAFCINLNCQQDGPGIDNDFMLVDACDLSGWKHGVDHGCGTFISSAQGTLQRNIIQECAFHDFKNNESSCIFGRNIERLVLRDNIFYSLQDAIAYQLNSTTVHVLAYRNKGHSAFIANDRFFRMRYTGQTWKMFGNQWHLTTGGNNRIIEYTDALLGTLDLADKYWAPAQANPFEGLTANKSMATWLLDFPACSAEDPGWYDPAIGDFTTVGPPSATVLATLPSLSASATAISVITSVVNADLPTLSASAVALSGNTSATAAATLPGLSASSSATLISSSTGVASLPTLTATASASGIASSTGSATLPGITAVGVATSITPATGLAYLPGLTAVATATTTAVATGAATLPSLTAAATTSLDVRAAVTATLPALSASGVSIASQGSGTALIGKWSTMTGLRYTNPLDIVSVDVDAYVGLNPLLENGCAGVIFEVESPTGYRFSVNVVEKSLRFPDFGPYSLSQVTNPGSGRMAPLWAYGFSLPVGIFPGGTIRVRATVYSNNGNSFEIGEALTIFNDSDSVDRRPNQNEIYVNPETGDDDNPGTEMLPVATIMGGLIRGKNDPLGSSYSDTDLHGLVVYLSDHEHVLGGLNYYLQGNLHTSDDGWVQLVSTTGLAKLVADWQDNDAGVNYPQSYVFARGFELAGNFRIRISNCLWEDGQGAVTPPDNSSVNVCVWVDGGESYSTAPRSTNFTMRFLDKRGGVIAPANPPGFSGTRNSWVTGHYRHHVVDGFLGTTWVMDCKLQYVLAIALQAFNPLKFYYVNLEISDIQLKGDPTSEGYAHIDDGEKLTILTGGIVPEGLAVCQQNAVGMVATNSAATTTFYEQFGHLVGSTRVGVGIRNMPPGPTGSVNDGTYPILATGVTAEGFEYVIYENPDAVSAVGVSSTEMFTSRISATSLAVSQDLHPDILQLSSDTEDTLLSNVSVTNSNDAQGYFTSTRNHRNLWMVNVTDGNKGGINNFAGSTLIDCGFINCSFSGRLIFERNADHVNCSWLNCVFESTGGLVGAPNQYINGCHWIDTSSFGADSAGGLNPSSGPWYEDPVDESPYLWIPADANQGTGIAIISTPSAYYFSAAGGNVSRGAWLNVAAVDWQGLSPPTTTPGTGSGTTQSITTTQFSASAVIDRLASTSSVIEITTVPAAASASVNVQALAELTDVALVIPDASVVVDVIASYVFGNENYVAVRLFQPTIKMAAAVTSSLIPLTVGLQDAEGRVDVRANTELGQVTSSLLPAFASVFTITEADLAEVYVELQSASAEVSVVANTSRIDLSVDLLPQPQTVSASVEIIPLSTTLFNASAYGTVLAEVDLLELSVDPISPTIGLGVLTDLIELSISLHEASAIGTILAEASTILIQTKAIDQYGVDPGTALVSTIDLSLAQISAEATISTRINAGVIQSNINLYDPTIDASVSAQADALSMLVTLFPAESNTAATAINIPNYLQVTLLDPEVRSGTTANVDLILLTVVQQNASTSTSVTTDVDLSYVYITLHQALAGIPVIAEVDTLSISLVQFAALAEVTVIGAASQNSVTITVNDPYVYGGSAPSPITYASGLERDRITQDLESNPLPTEEWRLVQTQI